MENAVTVNELRKSYGDIKAVDGISFEILQGSFFAFLGPNGAGKSTTIQILTSILKQDSGEASIFGRSPRDPESKRSIGVVFQDPKLDKSLTVRENLETRAALYGLKDAEMKDSVRLVMETTECTEFADRKYGELSGGQRRRVDIARALVHKPQLLILDEPTTGLDPKTRRLIWELIEDLNRNKGLTVLLTTHYMEEAAGADDIVIINRGRIVAHGTPQELRDRHCSDRLVFVPKDADSARKILTSEGIAFTEDKGVFTVPLAKTADSVPIIGKLGDNFESIEVRTGTLDEAFINITGEAIE